MDRYKKKKGRIHGQISKKGQIYCRYQKGQIHGQIPKRSDSWIDIKKVRFIDRYQKRSDLWIDIFLKVRFMGRYHNISVKVIKIKNISDCLNQEQDVKISE